MAVFYDLHTPVAISKKSNNRKKNLYMKRERENNNKKNLSWTAENEVVLQSTVLKKSKFLAVVFISAELPIIQLSKLPYAIHNL